MIGDIHANIRALEAALRVATRAGYDDLVFLGDILTYGIDVAAVTARVAAECDKGRAVLLRGNHDTLYLRPDDSSVVSYVGKLPPWIRECIDFTARTLPSAIFESLPFTDSCEKDHVFFAHANPFNEQDWRYLNTKNDHLEACIALELRNLRCGVFGHTHRVKAFAPKPDTGTFLDTCAGRLLMEQHCGPHIINAGSIGQPRSRSRQAYILVIDIEQKYLAADFKPVDYEISAHLDGLARSGLRHETIEKLTSFFT